MFEGPDRAGKSTLAALVADRLDRLPASRWPGRLAVARFRSVAEDRARTLEDGLARSRPWAVLDRGWPSELAYTSATGRPAALDEVGAARLAAAGAAAGGLVVVMPMTRAAFDQAEVRHAGRPETHPASVRRAANDWYWRLPALLHELSGDLPALLLPVGDAREQWPSSAVDFVTDAYLRRQAIRSAP